MKELIEPFIILPYGNMQDSLFFINKSIKSEYRFLKNMAYKKISNVILHDNLIKVIRRIDEVIIFHIYPTSYKERCSNREGQCLIVGYIINRICFQQRFDELICACSLFFEAILKCGYSDEQGLSIPTKFVKKVNSRVYNMHIENNLNEVRGTMTLIIKRKLKIDIMKPYENLEIVYDFIRKHVILLGEYWFLVDTKDITYYKKRNKAYNIKLRDERDG